MDRYGAMKIFVKVADSGSFAEAGRQLYLSAPAITRAIAWLEQLVGSRLFVRTTRAVKITEAGVQYLADCRRILTDIEAAEASACAAYATPSGTLTVTAPALFGRLYVLPILMDFLNEHPKVNGRALFVNRVTHLVDEEIDVAVRIGKLPDSGYRAVRVGSVRSVVCGAPSYFDGHGVPQVPADLRHHTLIAAAPDWGAVEWGFGGAEPTQLTVHPRLLCNTDEATMAATLAGWGLTRTMVYKIAPALADGRLRCVLSEFEEPPLPIHVLHPEGRHVSNKVRLFLDQLVDRLRRDPVLN